MQIGFESPVTRLRIAVVYSNLPECVVEADALEDEKVIVIYTTDVASDEFNAFKELIDYKNRTSLFRFELSNPIIMCGKNGADSNPSEPKELDPQPNPPEPEVEPDPGLERLVTIRSRLTCIPGKDNDAAPRKDDITGREQWTMGLLAHDTQGQHYIATAAHAVVCQDIQAPRVFLSEYRDSENNHCLQEVCKQGYKGYYGGHDIENSRMQHHISCAVSNDESRKGDAATGGEAQTPAPGDGLDSEDTKLNVAQGGETVNPRALTATVVKRNKNYTERAKSSESTEKSDKTIDKKLTSSLGCKLRFPILVDSLLLPIRVELTNEDHIFLQNLDWKKAPRNFQFYMDHAMNLEGKEVFMHGNASFLRKGRINRVFRNVRVKTFWHVLGFTVERIPYGDEDEEATQIRQFANSGDSGAAVVSWNTNADGRHLVYGLVWGLKAGSGSRDTHVTYCTTYREALQFFADTHQIELCCCSSPDNCVATGDAASPHAVERPPHDAVEYYPSTDLNATEGERGVNLCSRTGQAPLP